MKEDFYDFDIYDIPDNALGTLDFNVNIRLIVICNEEDHIINNDLLTKILGAIDFENDRNAKLLLLSEGSQVNLASICPPEIDTVICFGVMPKDISFNASFRPNHFYQTEKFNLMLSYKLADLQTDKNKKMALWQALQDYFKK